MSQIQNIKMDQLTARDAFDAIGARKLDTFETVSELASALKPYLYLTAPPISQDEQLKVELEEKEKQFEELDEKNKKLVDEIKELKAKK